MRHTQRERERHQKNLSKLIRAVNEDKTHESQRTKKRAVKNRVMEQSVVCFMLNTKYCNCDKHFALFFLFWICWTYFHTHTQHWRTNASSSVKCTDEVERTLHVQCWHTSWLCAVRFSSEIFIMCALLFRTIPNIFEHLSFNFRLFSLSRFEYSQFLSACVARPFLFSSFFRFIFPFNSCHTQLLTAALLLYILPLMFLSLISV